jgi:alpha-D-ribose 1-methylphosphonate 5-triphosphate synthase subunit PhnL
MQTPILQVDGYSKHFSLHEQNKLIPASHNVSFTVMAGQLAALTGPTGAGKSSVLKGIYRTYLASTGRILYRDRLGHVQDLVLASDHQILELRRRDISFVTQFLHCLPRQSTLAVVAQPLLSLGVDRADASQRAADLLSAMNLPQRLWSVSPATFSGGERQRVNLARGLIAKPRLLLLDEPTASLDATTAECVIRLIEELKTQGTAMLAIFHHREITQRLADQVVEMSLPPATETFFKETA